MSGGGALQGLRGPLHGTPDPRGALVPLGGLAAPGAVAGAGGEREGEGGGEGVGE